MSSTACFLSWHFYLLHLLHTGAKFFDLLFCECKRCSCWLSCPWSWLQSFNTSLWFYPSETFLPVTKRSWTWYDDHVSLYNSFGVPKIGVTQGTSSFFFTMIDLLKSKNIPVPVPDSVLVNYLSRNFLPRILQSRNHKLHRFWWWKEWIIYILALKSDWRVYSAPTSYETKTY